MDLAAYTQLARVRSEPIETWQALAVAQTVDRVRKHMDIAIRGRHLLERRGK